jgi:hypothetical protein
MIFICIYAFLFGQYGNMWYRSFLICISKHHHHQGSNFGAGFYNDHHFHFGYHIYAAAVAAKYDNIWGRKFHERILLLVRDIHTQVYVYVCTYLCMYMYIYIHIYIGERYC